MVSLLASNCPVSGGMLQHSDVRTMVDLLHAAAAAAAVTRV